MTRKQVKKDMNRNPTGSGGFGDNPQNINFTGRPKGTTPSIYYHQYHDTPVSEIYARKDKALTGAEALAWLKYNAALHGDQKAIEEITDRTEGKSTQKIEGSMSFEVTQLCDKLETNYDELGQQAERQMVAANPPVQNIGQIGQPDTVQAQLPPASTPAPAEVAPVQPDLESEAVRIHDALLS